MCVLMQQNVCCQVDVTAGDALGRLPLHLAAQAGAADSVTFLLKSGANPNQRADTGLTPLHYATKVHQLVHCIVIRACSCVGGPYWSREAIIAAWS